MEMRSLSVGDTPLIASGSAVSLKWLFVQDEEYLMA